MNFISFEESKDITLGKKGTPLRDSFEAEMESEREALRLGELVRNARKEQQLTQKELGERIGVGEAQISKIESGRASTLSTISRIFKALGVQNATLDLGSLGKVALW